MLLLSMRLAEISKAMPAGPVFADVKEELALLSQLARSIEQELEVHRLRERHRIAKAEMDGAATDALAELARGPGGVVVRPDFRRKS